MGVVSTIWAPVHRALARVASAESGFPLNAAPSMDFLASGIQDHRLPYNKRGSSVAQPGILGWYGGADPVVCNLVPSIKAVANIAAAANPASGVAMTLVSVSGAGAIALSTSAPAFFPMVGRSVTAGVAIESLPTLQTFGQNGNFQTGFYDRATVVGRCVSVTGVGSGSGGAVTISGYDCYGVAITQTITLGAGVNTVNSTKAFKVVTSVVPAFTDSHTISVGTADIFGFGIRASIFPDVSIWYNDALVTASTGFVAAVTSTASATTGDTRGTYAVQSATDGAKRLYMIVRPTLSALVTSPTTGLFGVTQA
jgi:hypothetical protein